MLTKLWTLLKGEVRIAWRTFWWAWLVLSLGLMTAGTWASRSELTGHGSPLLLLLFGLVLSAAYAFWPAVGAAGCRVAYRILGAGTFIAAPVVLGGVAGALYLFGPLFGRFLSAIFAGASGSPCGAHSASIVGGVFTLFCLLVAVAQSPASLLALIEMLALVGVAFALGSIPGLLLWLVLALRRLVKVFGASSFRG